MHQKAQKHKSHWFYIESYKNAAGQPTWDPAVYSLAIEKIYRTLTDKLFREKPYRETTVFGKRHTGRPLCSDPMIQNIILPQIGLPQETFPKMQYREPMLEQARNHIPQGHQKPSETHIKNSVNLNFFFQILIGPFSTRGPRVPGFPGYWANAKKQENHVFHIVFRTMDATNQENHVFYSVFRSLYTKV